MNREEAAIKVAERYDEWAAKEKQPIPYIKAIIWWKEETEIAEMRIAELEQKHNITLTELGNVRAAAFALIKQCPSAPTFCNCPAHKFLQLAARHHSKGAKEDGKD